MPFIKRDANGEVVALFREQNAEAGDYLPPHHPEVQAFVGSPDAANGHASGQPEMRHDPSDCFSMKYSARLGWSSGPTR